MFAVEMFSSVFYMLAFLFICNDVFCEPREPPYMSQYDYETKLLYKMIKIEEEVKAFRQFVDEMKAMQKQTEVEQKDKLNNALESFKNSTEKYFHNTEEMRKQTEKELKINVETTLDNFKNSSDKRLAEMSEDSEKILYEMRGSLNDFKTTLATWKNGTGIGFTVNSPKASPTSGQITFNTVVSNEGGGFDLDTGVFTCSVKGYYYFSFYVLQAFTYIGQASCRIYRNYSSQLVISYTDPRTTTNGHSAATNGVFVRLEVGDQVKLAGCTSVSTMNYYSTFSGFLITADPL